MNKLKAILFVLAISLGILKASEKSSLPFTIQFTEKDTGWPVPLVEIRTTHQVRFFSDNAGIIAFDLVELMGKDTWIDVVGNGYDVPKDGFGYRGVRIKPIPGGKIRIELQRNINAKRIGRLTGAGIFAESQKLGLEKEWTEQDVLGCDSVQNAVHGGRMFWLWGDTTLAHYPLGIFDCSSATTAIKPLNALTPPLRLKFDYFADAGGKPRGVAKMPGTGPTWVSGYTSLRDNSGVAHLVGSYVKIKPPMDAYESGLCVWNDSKEQFEQHRVIWTKSESNPKPPPIPEGHPVFWRDEKGREWVLFGNPLPTLRCPANFEGWQDPVQWEILKPQTTLASVSDGKAVKPHSGSIAWNAYRKKFVTVFMESFGKPSSFGELWYAEAENPLGPWGPAIKILSHENYTFYNPRIHPEFTEPDSPVLLFEGTYTMQFANKPAITPRYDYNQILYRLDLDDPALIKAQASQHQSHVEPLESLIVSADKRGFAFKKSAITFRPWGCQLRQPRSANGRFLGI